MTVFERLKKIISAFEIYDTDNNVFLRGELKAYSSGIDMILNVLSTMEKECFVQTATGYGLANKEHLFDSFERKMSVIDKRQMLLNALSIDENSFNVDGMKRFLGRFPTGYTIYENHSNNSIIINLDRNGWITENYDYVEKSINNFFPAHLAVTISTKGLLWSEIESKNIDFATMDSKDYNWKQIELL